MEESRLQKSVRNVSVGLLSKLVILVLGFVDRKFFITILGEGMLGINGLFTNILLVLSLAELGMTNVMVFSYYKPLADKDYVQLNKLTAFYKKIYNTIALVVAIIGILLIPFLKYIVNLETPIENLVWIYLMFLANTVISYLFIYKSTILNADQNGYIASKMQIIFDVTRQFCQIIALIVTKNILVYLGVKVLFAFLYNFVLVKIVEKKYPYLKDTAETLDHEEKHSIIETMKAGFIYKVSAVMLNGTDNIIISVVVGTIYVGYLVNYNTIFDSITAFVVVLFGALTASLGNLNVQATAKKRLEVFHMMFFVGSWISRILVPCFFFLSSDMIRVWLGENYVLSDAVVAAKVILVYYTCTLNPIFSFREATGLFRKSKYMIFAGSVVNIVLSFVLGAKFGVFGVLLASFISMSVTYVWYEPILLYRDYFDAKPIDYLKRHLQNILVIAISMLVIAQVMKQLPVDGWGMLFIKACICFILANVISFLCSYRSNEFKVLLDKVFSMLNLRKAG